MAMRLNIEFEQLLDLVDQLNDAQRQDLMARLLKSNIPEPTLTIEEKNHLLDVVKDHRPVKEVPSVRREDWYGEDGR